MKAGILLRNFYSSVFRPIHSKLFFVGDSANWVLNWEICEIQKIARRLGITACTTQGFGIFRQSVFYFSKYVLRKPQIYLNRSSNIAFPYYHGYPSSGETAAVECYQNLKKYHQRIAKIQVSHSYMKEIILDSGIDPNKVLLIPIAINSDFFQLQSADSKKHARHRYGIPQEAMVVGSFQKDGNGWGQGNEPKLIKGPDIFLKAVGILKKSVPELFVLLSGPARGYVKKGLERLKIPYKHIYLRYYPEIGQLYQCLDLYIVSSREEGGPKAVLESMASGIPLVTTRVGQAMDLVTHRKNALMVNPEDFEGLAFCGEEILADTQLRERIVKRGFSVANANTYSAHLHRWKVFFDGFVQTKSVGL